MVCPYHSLGAVRAIRTGDLAGDLHFSAKHVVAGREFRGRMRRIVGVLKEMEANILENWSYLPDHISRDRCWEETPRQTRDDRSNVQDFVPINFLIEKFISCLTAITYEF
jgi:hypothetical protein